MVMVATGKHAASASSRKIHRKLQCVPHPEAATPRLTLPSRKSSCFRRGMQLPVTMTLRLAAMILLLSAASHETCWPRESGCSTPSQAPSGWGRSILGASAVRIGRPLPIMMPIGGPQLGRNQQKPVGSLGDECKLPSS